jgi:hypothetical protein
MTVEQPPHPMHALTTYELKNYRRELEHSLRALPEHVAVRVLLQQRLAEVLAEQDSGIACTRPMDRHCCRTLKGSHAVPGTR